MANVTGSADAGVRFACLPSRPDDGNVSFSKFGGVHLEKTVEKVLMAKGSSGEWFTSRRLTIHAPNMPDATVWAGLGAYRACSGTQSQSDLLFTI